MTQIDKNSFTGFLEGKEKGEHDAACLHSYFTLGIHEQRDRWRRYDLSQPTDQDAHSTLLDMLGIPEPNYLNATEEHITPLVFTIPSDAFFTRQIFAHEDSSAYTIIYRAWYQQSL